VKGTPWTAARRKAHSRRIKALHAEGAYAMQPKRIKATMAAKSDRPSWPSVADAVARLARADEIEQCEGKLTKVERLLRLRPESPKLLAQVAELGEQLDALRAAQRADQRKPDKRNGMARGEDVIEAPDPYPHPLVADPVEDEGALA
jgi:hypothetical protein